MTSDSMSEIEALQEAVAHAEVRAEKAAEDKLKLQREVARLSVALQEAGVDPGFEVSVPAMPMTRAGQAIDAFAALRDVKEQLKALHVRADSSQDEVGKALADVYGKLCPSLVAYESKYGTLGGALLTSES